MVKFVFPSLTARVTAIIWLTIRNKISVKFDSQYKTFLSGKYVLNVACKILAILSNGQNDAYKRQLIMPPLVQIMACRPFGAKPLSKSMMVYC